MFNCLENYTTLSVMLSSNGQKENTHRFTCKENSDGTRHKSSIGKEGKKEEEISE
jgi:hypothetical protein